MGTTTLHAMRLVAGLGLVAEGVRFALAPALAGIPLVLGGLAVLACNQPAVDRLVVRLETWRHARLQPVRIRR